MKRTVNILSDRIVKDKREASIPVKTKEEVEEAIEKLMEFVSTHSDIVYLKVADKVLDENNGYWSVTFMAKFNIEDRYVDNRLYKEGGTVIYLSNAFRDDINDIGTRLFGRSPSWGSGYTSFTFLGRLKA